MNSRLLTLFCDSGTPVDNLGRWEPPGERLRYRECERHGRYSVEVSACPRCVADAIERRGESLASRVRTASRFRDAGAIGGRESARVRRGFDYRQPRPTHCACGTPIEQGVARKIVRWCKPCRKARDAASGKRAAKLEREIAEATA